MSSLRLAIAAFLLIRAMVSEVLDLVPNSALYDANTASRSSSSFSCCSITRAVWDLVPNSSCSCCSITLKLVFLLLLFNHTSSLGLGSELSSIGCENVLAL
eukprot:TRINITY_DN826_c0_g1_i25.p2 TRINITY_DN826_c0_g1~~TRINITY_DN826_c0_g1_i25.p2  ORF type:complete len:101 (+),score=7.68 TRINITY_DN826_c0_g1_i25:663-965(+)